MAISVRSADASDADLIVELISMASDGVVPMLWAACAPEGVSETDIGRAIVSEDDGEFSYAHTQILEADDETVAGVIGYPMTAEMAAPEPGMPDKFLPVKGLEARVVGHWYINVIAVLPGCRGHGYGRKLLEHTEALARRTDCAGLALIVAATNAGALRLYRRFGFVDAARRPFDLADFGHGTTEAVLMVKDF